jgi:uncharacterized membrane protein YkvA (DUF1232 family)
MRWFSMVRTVHRYWRMAHDPRTPAAVRYLIYGGIAFTLIPDDWLPDWIPGLGLVDEAAVIPGVIAASMLLIPQEVKDDADKETEKAIEDKKQAGPSYQPPAKVAGVA